ncbi:hypothetical protein PUR71_20165 [Streptomyces sp. SP17BM10]|uniref:hypothetical protein n=1 Tax=Streptomyces sp. SP17BM10 TaxID=3002530 RepID=UPI002E7A250B|nr:hypothetical protein [Streptomyces sp. SP17BM10]MEE1785206.1 hypothetical protein [Streptomyces sp. SP17BM10]
MRVHRTQHARHFTVLPNAVLQYRRLSYTARGLLADLLSRPDGWREDGRHMAATSPQGRGAVRKALKELADAGFYRVETVRLPDGTLRSEAHVYDTPWPSPPSATRPAPGRLAAGPADSPPVKNRQQEPALPDEQTRQAVAALFRAIRPEPRLRLGQAEAEKLAPLVAQWLERGCTPSDLAQALLPGLPSPMHSAAAVLRYRLEHKMPPCRAAERPAAPRYAECAECRDPVPRPGLCRACKSLQAVVAGHGAGATRARTALRSAPGAPSAPSSPRRPAGSRP